MEEEGLLSLRPAGRVRRTSRSSDLEVWKRENVIPQVRDQGRRGSLVHRVRGRVKLGPSDPRLGRRGDLGSFEPSCRSKRGLIPEWTVLGAGGRVSGRVSYDRLYTGPIRVTVSNKRSYDYNRVTSH